MDAIGESLGEDLNYMNNQKIGSLQKLTKDGIDSFMCSNLQTKE